MTKYLKIDKKVEKIVENVSKYMLNLTPEDIKREIFKAYEYTKEAHDGQDRLSGEPYLIHPVEATEILLDLKPDLPTIQACFLHDVIEDTSKTGKDISDSFGKEVAFLCIGMEKLSKVRYRGEERSIGSLRKMFIAMAEDLRVVFIKLADRLHNMQTLSFHPKKDKRERIALETLNIYSPIADRLGLYNLKNSLDEECFKILEPIKYKKLKKELEKIESDIKIFTNNATKEIDKLFEGKIDSYEIDFRVKSIFSIHKKIVKKGLTSAHDLYDLYGIRIMVRNESDCYKALGLIHNIWTPLPNRFKDYIALPKPNGYKSLHTNVMGFIKNHRKQPTEFQIKTFEMKVYSDIGVAAHFEYKDQGSKFTTGVDWVGELNELVNNVLDADFVGSLKIDLFKDRIYVFTPKGDFINLPAGSTAIDFAYYVHSDLGDHISIAKVNNSVYPLDKELHNGDIVDIIIDKNKKPNPFWISFVKTVKAKNRIKNYLKKEDKDLHIERGKEMINKYLEKAGLEYLSTNMSVLKNLDGVVYSKSDKLNLLEQVGNFSVTPSSIIKKILKTLKINKVKKVAKSDKNDDNNLKNDKKRKKIDLIIGGEPGLKYRLGDCCEKVLPDHIVGHINNKSVITIHKRSCKTIKKVNKKRLLSAYITGKEDESTIFHIELVFHNNMGVLMELSAIIFSMGIDVDKIYTNKLNEGQTEIYLELKILDYEYLIMDRFLDRIKLKFEKTLVSSKIGKNKKSIKS